MKRILGAADCQRSQRKPLPRSGFGACLNIGPDGYSVHVGFATALPLFVAALTGLGLTGWRWRPVTPKTGCREGSKIWVVAVRQWN